MKILVSMGLADSSLRSLIAPIAMLDGVHGIVIVRDSPGPDIPKVTYATPPRWSVGMPVLKTFLKFLILLSLAIRTRPDVIHGYLLVPNGLMACVAGTLTRRNTGVSFLAGPIELSMVTFLLGGSRVGTCAYNRPLPKVRGINRILLFVTKRFSYITVTGRYTREFLLRNGIPGERISIIPHAIDPVNCPESTPKSYDVLFVGRLAKVKHVETLVQAIGIARGHDPPLKAAIIGKGPEEQGLKALSDELGTSALIEFLGYVPDVYYWYNRARMSIIPSEREGFPYAAIESLSCGCPVIASACGDITDVLIPGVNGVLVDDYSDSPAFAREMMRLIDSPGELQELSRNTVKSIAKVNREEVSRVWMGILEGLER